MKENRINWDQHIRKMICGIECWCSVIAKSKAKILEDQGKDRILN